MRCARCGNENAEGNRYCGMCGAPLMPAAQAASPAAKQPPTPAMAGQTAARNPAQEVRQERISANAPAMTTAPARPSSGNSTGPRPVSSLGRPQDEPTISGPSFLGLNQPGPARSGRESDRRGDGRDQLQSSGNLSYLLDDDEDDEPKRGWGKVLLVLVALALAGGFGYLHWKQGGFNWLMAGNKPAATQPAPDSAQPPADSSAAAPATTAPNAASGAGSNGGDTAMNGTPSAPPAPSGAAPAAAAQTQPATPPGTAAPASGATAPITEAPASSAPGSGASAGTAPAQANDAQNAATPAAGASGAAPGSAVPGLAVSGSAEPSSSVSGSAAQTSDEEQPPAVAVAPSKRAPKPRAPKPAAAKPSDAVNQAKQYIYGSGVRQDCERGLSMLKSASRSDANAMIALGVVYSTGTCVPRDLPTAYRWFALGLHKEPDNQALQDDLQQLWSQMTQPERQLAIKLSQ